MAGTGFDQEMQSYERGSRFRPQSTRRGHWTDKYKTGFTPMGVIPHDFGNTLNLSYRFIESMVQMGTEWMHISIITVSTPDCLTCTDYS